MHWSSRVKLRPLQSSWAGSPTELSTEEVELLLRYILSSSFISASYHLQETRADETRRPIHVALSLGHSDQIQS